MSWVYTCGALVLNHKLTNYNLEFLGQLKGETAQIMSYEIIRRTSRLYLKAVCKLAQGTLCSIIFTTYTLFHAVSMVSSMG